MGKRTNLRTSLVMAVFLMAMACTAAGDVIYVDDDASLGGNGQNWATPYRYLQDALTAAVSGDEIRVAEGIYKPDEGGGNTPGDRTATFQLKNGVVITGGYAGFGQPDPDARDIEVYETVLSGDLNGDDEPNFANNGENSYHVVMGSETDETTVLDGFIITGAKADGPWQNKHDRGGGMYNHNASPRVLRCTFIGNWAKDSGAAIYNNSGNPRVYDCRFIANHAYRGGAIANKESQLELFRCTFSRNSCDDNGGGMHNNSGDVILTDCDFTDNVADYAGGAIYNTRSGLTLINCAFTANFATEKGGAMNNRNSDPTLTNCIFLNNSANTKGGGMHNFHSSPLLTNCKFTGNFARDSGAAMYNLVGGTQTLINCTLAGNHAGNNVGGIVLLDAVTELTNCILWGNSDSGDLNESAQIHKLPGQAQITVNYSCIQGWTGSLGGTGNIGEDLCFVEPGYWDANGVWVDGDYHLQPDSACIDAGDNTAVPPSVVVDLDGNYRIANGTVDMGAYEFGSTPPPSTLFVDARATGANDGSNWENAFTKLREGLSFVAGTFWVKEIRVAQGVYKPAAGYTPPPPPPPPGGSSSDQDTGVMALDRMATFQLKNGIVIKGGYAGFGQPDPNARDIKVYETVLSGDLLGNDVGGFEHPSRNDNSYHVVTGSGTNDTAVLDGFTITGGNAKGLLENRNGGGMYNWEGSPTVTNCTFTGNAAQTFGGGMLNRRDSSPTLNNCVFRGNLSDNHGGGMSNVTSNPTLTNCTFSGNRAVMAGGMFNFMRGDPTLTNCTFSGNTARWYGGGMRNKDRSSPTLTNCTFSRNAVTGLNGSGGAMRNVNWSSPTLTNCTFAANSATNGSALACGSYQQSEPSNLELTNCILWDGGDEIWNEDNSVIRITYSDVQGGWLGTGNINANPLFVDSAIDDYHLLPDSPCIDAGTNTPPGGLPTTDMDGNPRPLDGDKDGIAVADMGAYEFVANVPPVSCIVGGNRMVEAEGPFGARVTLDGSCSSDSDSAPGTNDDINDFDWYKVDPCDPNFEDFLGSGEIIDCNLSLGEHIIILEVFDRAGAFDIDELTVIVLDTTPPVFTTIPQGLTVECDGNYNVAELNAWLAGVAAVDKCGSVTITNDFVGILNECGATGSTTVTWTAEDESGNTTTTPPATFTIVDTTPPVIICPVDVTLECPADTSIETNGSATAGDVCGTITITHSNVWQPSCGSAGTLTRTWMATDKCGNNSSCAQTITVVDTTPPEFEFSVTPTVLWPPNHKMVLITPTWTVSDECDASPDILLVSIVMNEDDNIIGDGHTADDIEIGDDGSIYLRAERSGGGDNRVYTITYRAVDDCGNRAESSATVTVPHDQR